MLYENDVDNCRWWTQFRWVTAFGKMGAHTGQILFHSGDSWSIYEKRMVKFKLQRWDEALISHKTILIKKFPLNQWMDKRGIKWPATFSMGKILIYWTQFHWRMNDFCWLPVSRHWPYWWTCQHRTKQDVPAGILPSDLEILKCTQLSGKLHWIKYIWLSIHSLSSRITLHKYMNKD